MTCTRVDCPDCAEQMIHMHTRGAHESSSALGQHIHDNYPTTFYYADIDAVIYKMANSMLRIVEHKYRSGGVKSSQRMILPLLAIGVEVLSMFKRVHPESGVFVVWSDAPFSTATVARVIPKLTYEIEDQVDLTPDQFAAFKTGEVVLPGIAAVAS